MKKRNVISRKNLPTSSPVTFMAVLYLLLDKFNAPGWVWGAVGLLMLFIFIAWITSMVTDNQIDIINRNKDQK